MPNFGRKMWGWKHSLRGVSNTEFSPPVITLPFYPAFSTEYPVATYDTSLSNQYWFSGGKFIADYNVDYSTASELNGGLAFARFLGPYSTSDGQKYKVDVNVASNFNFIDPTAQSSEIYRQYISFDVQNSDSDPYGDWDNYLPGQSPDLYSTLSASSIKPLEYYDLLNTAELSVGSGTGLTIAGFLYQDFPFYGYDNLKYSYGFNSLTGYVEHHQSYQVASLWFTTNWNNIDYWMNNPKTVAGTTSLACSYQVNRWKALEPYNWRDAVPDLGGPANVDSGTDKKIHTVDSISSGTPYIPDTTERTIHYYANKTVKRTGDNNIPDVEGSIDLTFEIELALQRYGVQPYKSSTEAPTSERGTLANDANSQRVLSYVAGNFCYSKDELNSFNGPGTYILIPVFASLATLGGPNNTDIYDSSPGAFYHGELPLITRVGGHCYRYLIVAIRLEKRYMPGSYIVGSGMVVDFENIERTYNSKIAHCAGYFLGNSDRWPALANRENARLFSPEFIASTPKYGFEVTCFRVSECGAYGFYSGGSNFNVAYRPPGTYDQTDTDRMITRFRVNTGYSDVNYNVAGRHFWHVAGNANVPWSLDPFDHAAADFCYSIYLGPDINYAFGYDSDARPRVSYPGQFIKSFRFSNDGKYLYVLWQTRQGYLNYPTGRDPSTLTAYQWVERYLIASPIGYADPDFYFDGAAQDHSNDVFRLGPGDTTYANSGIYFAGTTDVYSVAAYDGQGGVRHLAQSIDVTPDGMYLQVLMGPFSNGLGEGAAFSPRLIEYFLGGSGDSNIVSPDDAYSPETDSTNALLPAYLLRQRTRDSDGSFFDSPYLGNSTPGSIYEVKKFVWPILPVRPGAVGSSTDGAHSDTYVDFLKSYPSQEDYRAKVNSIDVKWSEELHAADVAVPVPSDFSWNTDGTILYLFGAFHNSEVGQDNGLNHYEGSPFCIEVPMYPVDYPGTNSFQERAGSGAAKVSYEYLYANRVEGLKRLAYEHFPEQTLYNRYCPIWPLVEKRHSDLEQNQYINIQVTVGAYNGAGTTYTESLYLDGNDWGRFSTIINTSQTYGYRLSLRRNVNYAFRQIDASNVGNELQVLNFNGTVAGPSDGVYWSYTGTAGIDGILRLHLSSAASGTLFLKPVSGTSTCDYVVISHCEIYANEMFCIPLWKGATVSTSQAQQNSDDGISLLWRQPTVKRLSDVDSDGWLHRNRNAVYRYASTETRPQGQQAANVFAYHKGGKYLYFIAQDDSWNRTVNGSTAGTDPTLPDGVDHTYYRNYVAILPIYTNADSAVNSINYPLAIDSYLGKQPFEYSYQYRDWGYVRSRGLWGPFQLKATSDNNNSNVPSRREWGAMHLSQGEGGISFNMMSGEQSDASQDLRYPKLEFAWYYEGPIKEGTDFYSWDGQYASIPYKNKDFTRYSNYFQLHSNVDNLTSRSTGAVHPIYRVMGERNNEYHYVARDIRGGNWGLWILQRPTLVELDYPTTTNQLYWGYNRQKTTSPYALWNTTFLQSRWGAEDDIFNLPKYVWGYPNVTERNAGSSSGIYSHLINSHPDLGYYVTQQKFDSEWNLTTAGIAYQSSFDVPPLYNITNQIMPNSTNGVAVYGDARYEAYDVYTSHDIQRVMSFKFAENGMSLFVLTSGQLTQVGGQSSSAAAFTLSKYVLNDNYDISSATRVSSFTYYEDRPYASYWWSQIQHVAKCHYATDFVIHPDGSRFWVIGLDSTQSNYSTPAAWNCRTVVREFSLPDPFDFVDTTYVGFHTYDSIPAVSQFARVEIPVSLEIDATGENVYWTSQYANMTFELDDAKKMRHFRSPLQTAFDLRSPTTSTTSSTGKGIRTQAGTQWYAEDGAAQRIRFLNTNDRWYRNGVSNPNSGITNDYDVPNSAPGLGLSYDKNITLNASLGTLSVFDKPGEYKTQKPAATFSMGNAGMFWDRTSFATGPSPGGKRQNQAPYDMFIFEVSKTEDVVLLSDTQRITAFLFNNNTKGV